MDENDKIDKMTVGEFIASLSKSEKDTLYYALLWTKEGGGLGEGLLKDLFDKVKKN